MSFNDILFLHIIPICGNISSIMLYISDLPTIRKLQKSTLQQQVQNRQIHYNDTPADTNNNDNDTTNTPTSVSFSVDDMNGTIYCYLLCSCICWAAYGYIIHDPVVAPLNTFGSCVEFYIVIVYYTSMIQQYHQQIDELRWNTHIKEKRSEEASSKQNILHNVTDTHRDGDDTTTTSVAPLHNSQNIDDTDTANSDINTLIHTLLHKQQRYRLLIYLSTYLPIFFICIFAFSFPTGSPTQTIVFGVLANIMYLIFLASPLQQLHHIIYITRDASTSLSLPITLASMSNCILWCAYGIYINDYFICVPNGIGILLNSIQFVIMYLYRRKTVDLNVNDTIELQEKTVNYDDNPMIMNIMIPDGVGDTTMVNTNNATNIYHSHNKLYDDMLAPSGSSDQQNHHSSTKIDKDNENSHEIIDISSSPSALLGSTISRRVTPRSVHIHSAG